ncbi:hypothetical protein SNE40_020166 [Patella caerulea]
MNYSFVTSTIKRELENCDASDSASERKRKRKSRWNTDNDDKTSIPGMPAALPCNLSTEQQRQYIVHLQIEEISRKLRTGDLGIPPNPEARSPSPEPIYNNEGKRLNTREYRTRKKLEEERHRLVTEAVDLNKEYKPPADYKPLIVRVNDKVMIPQDEHPDINFVGLLIGPRGNTLKCLEKETGAKIIIRGKGSVKEGKIGRKDGQPLPGEDEPLHAYVTANNPENVKKAVEKIKTIIKQGIDVPEGQNDLRRQQLRELALLNGTLRENDGLAKLKQLQAAQNIITNTILCSLCGGTGHIAQDCKQKRPGDTFRGMTQLPVTSLADKAKMDSEYMSLMAELGEGPPPKTTQSTQMRTSIQQNFRQPFQAPPPNPMAMNPPWQQQQQQQQQQQMPPPQNNQQMRQPISMAPTRFTGTPQPLMNAQINQSQIQLNRPPNMTPPIPPPPMGQNNQPPLPPWQQQQPQMGMQNVPTSQMIGVPPPPPPTMITAPPPPPPSTQAQNSMANMPWLQNQVSGVPPPPPTTNTSRWGAQMPAAPPPPPPSALPPWQQNAVQNTMNAPPPPPTTSQQMTYSPVPPPPPPNSFNTMAGMNPMMVAPPPPPPPPS